MSDYIRLLRGNRNFASLWLAQVISLAGDWFNTITLSTLVVRYSNNSGLAISLFFLARFVPTLLLSPYAGVLVDRFNRKRLLIYSNVLRAFIVMGFLLATTADRLWLIYVLSVLQFTVAAVFEPAQSALIPRLVEEKDLIVANTLSSVTWSALLSIGAIIGGIVASIFGSGFALAFDAVTFAVGALLISGIQVPVSKRQAEVEPAAQLNISVQDWGTEASKKPAHHGSFREGLQYLAKHPSTIAVMLVKGGNSLGNVDTLMTIFATQIFVLGNDGQLSLGYMYSAFGVGAVVGPLIINRFNDGSVRKMRRLVTVGFVLALLGWLVLSSAGMLWIALAALFIRAMGGSVNWTYSSVIIQKTVPDRFLGRVFALDMAVFQLATVLSTIVHGALVDALGSEYVRHIALGTAGVALIPLLLWSWGVPHMERREVVQAVGD
ncbi:MAG: MFS transporter [Anaerolineae bacterium]